MIGPIGRSGARAAVPAQPLPGSEVAGTITIDVAAKVLMVTPEWVRRLTKDGWIAKTDRGRYRVVDVVQGYIRFLKDEARRATKTAAHNRLQGIRARPLCRSAQFWRPGGMQTVINGGFGELWAPANGDAPEWADVGTWFRIVLASTRP